MRKISMLTLILAGTLSSAAHAQLPGGNGSLGGGLGGNAGPVSGAIDGTLSGRGALHGDLPTRRTVGGVNEGSGRIADRTERLRERSAQRAERLRSRADATAIRTRDTAAGAASTAVRRGVEWLVEGCFARRRHRGDDDLERHGRGSAGAQREHAGRRPCQCIAVARRRRSSARSGQSGPQQHQGERVGRRECRRQCPRIARWRVGRRRRKRFGSRVCAPRYAGRRRALMACKGRQVLPAAPCASLRDCFHSVRSRSARPGRDKPRRSDHFSISTGTPITPPEHFLHWKVTPWPIV
jgi:hypothetical protein